MTATIELIQEATPRGEYKPTTLDELKAKADILVTAIDSHYEIVVKNPSIKLVELGQATDLKESYDDDGTLSFKFTRNGIVMKTFSCERKRAAWLLA